MSNTKTAKIVFDVEMRVKRMSRQLMVVCIKKGLKREKSKKKKELAIDRKTYNKRKTNQ